jgi:hypothetical protein
MENQTNQIEAVELAPANSITVQVPAEMDFSAMVERSANLGELKPLITLTAEYVELEKPGESFDGIFIGWQEMGITDKQTGEQKTLKASRFLINKQVKINAGAVLVNELERAKIAVGTAVRVTYLRKEGNTKLYTLTLLV